MTLTVSTVGELRPRAGGALGASSYRLVSQYDVDAFAQITGDRQWIHTNPVRARETASGATIVHGYYTPAMVPTLLAEVLPLDGFAMVVNCGLDKLRAGARGGRALKACTGEGRPALHYTEWLAERSGELRAAPKTLGNTRHKATARAPGTYVHAG
jgi:hypothetical protein